MPSFLKTLAMVDGLVAGNTPIAALIRHAEREALPGTRGEALATIEVPLVDSGRQDALRLGRALRGRAPLRLCHSPAPRCAETARLIARGCSSRGGESTMLGHLDQLLGPFIHDTKSVLELARRSGPGFVRDWFDGRLPPEMLQSRGQAAASQLRVLLRCLDHPARALTLCVTHDWNIMSVREEFFGMRHEDVGWLPYLDGIVAARTDGALLLGCQGRTRHLSLRELDALS